MIKFNKFWLIEDHIKGKKKVHDRLCYVRFVVGMCSKFMIKFFTTVFNKFWLIEDHIKGKKKCMIGCVMLDL